MQTDQASEMNIGEVWQDNFNEQEPVTILRFQKNFVFFRRELDTVGTSTFTFSKEFRSNYYLVEEHD